MAKRVLISAAGGANSSSDGYFPFSICSIATANSTEANAQITVKTPFVATNLFINITASTTTGTSTLRTRKNGANGNQSVSITAGTTGYLEDVTNHDVYAVNDTASFFLDRNGSMTVAILGCYIQSDEDIWVTSAFGSSAQAATAFSGIGLSGPLGTTNTLQRTYVESPLTFRNMSVYITANTWTNTTTYDMRINGSAGNIAVSVPTLSTGEFFDTSNTDTATATQRVQFGRTTATGSGSITTSRITVEVVPQDKTKIEYFAQNTAITQGTNNTYFCGFGAYVAPIASPETGLYPEFPEQAIINNFRISISANTASTTSTLTLRRTQIDTALTISVTSGTTGLLSDTSNSLAVRSGDQITVGYTRVAGTGTINIRNLQFLATYPMVNDVTMF